MEESISNLSKHQNRVMHTPFNLHETTALRSFFKKHILPYYELYELVVDRRPKYTIQAELFQPISSKEEASLSAATVIDVETVEVLKPFIGIKPVKEEKKDVKKK